MRSVESEYLRDNWSQLVKEAANDGVLVVAWWRVPEALMVSVGMWEIGRRKVPVRESACVHVGSTRALHELRDVREDLQRGHHTVVEVRNKPRAVLVPYGWARLAYTELRLPEVPETPSSRQGLAEGGELAIVVYRSTRMASRLAEEFGDAEDPVWEMDRRLSSSRGGIPPERQQRLRAVVYVEDGTVARVRAIEPGLEWGEQELRSLAPVSVPLLDAEIAERFPTLGLRPGDTRLAGKGSPREYVEL